ncbi:beta-glucosidase family protein [Chengkuizengella axinellae]|uniref:beta-glucosidase n=1 Tax=Chengkuizengella axinellae TaxID=3064388 RepID=A0ABT9IXY3_9BACL|nr:glycoside hydrolase family 3 N-terminal domain-containing protein [Chengkuizengella sp. 2205SS18-9]MDP5273977.1 glycoside hydrolase family 3 N-terminal domain-containing protein [Chengkuizengella sp. 2205SS18-9]
MKTKNQKTIIITVLSIVILIIAAVIISNMNKDTGKNNGEIVEGGELLYTDPNQPIDVRVEDLLSRMTLEEKAGQMTQVNVTKLQGSSEWDAGPLNDEWLVKTFKDYHVGSVLSGGGTTPVSNEPKLWAEMTNEIQKSAIENSRLGIPIIYGVDAVHGHNNVIGATIFPHNLGLAASRNTDLIEELGASTAKSVRATGIHWNFAPVADVGRDLRWGRFYETFGEDPYLVTKMATASIIGQQGEDISSNENVAATAKHFLGYSQPLNGQDRSSGEIPLRTLREVFYPPFEDAIENGAKTVMVNSGSINGVPVHASQYLLTDVLRGEMGFEGVIVTDWEDIIRLHSQYHITDNYKDSIARSINAGVDMSMVPVGIEDYTKNLIDAVNEELIPMERFDDAVSRILTLKFELGLFENPYIDAEQTEALTLNQDRELARQAAVESLTLLENDGILPLTTDIKTILVTGPSADNIANQMGGWTIGWQGLVGTGVPPAVTFLEGIQNAVSSNTNVLFETDTAKAVEAANNADVTIVVFGEGPYAEFDGDTTTAAVPPDQTELIKSLAETETPVVGVLVAGRPLIVTDLIRDMDAFIMAYLPGTEGGNALADVLFGKENPSGKLAFSWPSDIGQLPMFYNYYPKSTANDKAYLPLYEFGYGFGYSKFNYSNLTANDEVPIDGIIKVSVDVTNSGDFAGSESIELYVNQQLSSVLTPVKKLAGFSKVYLKPKETKTVELELPVSQLAIVPGDVLGDAEKTVEEGIYTLNIDKLAKPVSVIGSEE